MCLILNTVIDSKVNIKTNNKFTEIKYHNNKKRFLINLTDLKISLVMDLNIQKHVMQCLFLNLSLNIQKIQLSAIKQAFTFINSLSIQ